MGSEHLKVVEDLITQIDKLSLDKMMLVTQTQDQQLELYKDQLRISELEIVANFWRQKISDRFGEKPEQSASPNSNGSSSKGVSGEGIKFFVSTIEQLALAQEELLQEVKMLKEDYKELQREKEREMDWVLQECCVNVERHSDESAALIRDIIMMYEPMMEKRKEFEMEAKAKPGLKDGDGKKGLLLLQKFKELPKELKGIVVAAFAAIRTATAGWAGWGFMSWLWEKICWAARKVYEQRHRIKDILAAFNKFVDSESFKKFTQAWGEGKTFWECVGHFASSAFLKEALKIGPEILTHLVGTKPASGDNMV